MADKKLSSKQRTNNSKAVKQRANNPQSVLWKFAEGKRISLGNQLLITVYSNYLRATRGKKFVAADPHASERVETELLSMKVMAEFLGVPLWRVVDIVIAFGIAAAYREFEPALKARLEHHHKVSVLMEQIDTAQDDIGKLIFGDDEKYASTEIGALIAEAFPEYLVKRARVEEAEVS